MKKSLVAAIVGLSIFSLAPEEASAFDGRIRGMLRRAVNRDVYRPSWSSGMLGTVRRGADATYNLAEDGVQLYLDVYPTARILQGKSPLPF